MQVNGIQSIALIYTFCIAIHFCNTHEPGTQWNQMLQEFSLAPKLETICIENQDYSI